jgi:hypothetical protein
MRTTEPRREAPSVLLEAAAALLEGAGGSLLTTSLNKALFYLDLHALLETGETATGETYVALRAGPVIEGYRVRLIEELERSRIAMQDDDNPKYMPVVLLHPVKATRLGAEVLALARVIGAWAASKQAGELSDFSHENAAWKLAWDNGAGQGSALDLRLAIQQLADDDPWLQEPVSAEEKAAFDAADQGEANGW